MRYPFAAPTASTEATASPNRSYPANPAGSGTRRRAGRRAARKRCFGARNSRCGPRRLAGRDVDDDHGERPDERGPREPAGELGVRGEARRELPDEAVAVVEGRQGDLRRGSGWRSAEGAATAATGGGVGPAAGFGRVPEHEEHDRQQGRSRPRPRARAWPGRRGRSASSRGRAGTAGPCLPRPGDAWARDRSRRGRRACGPPASKTTAGPGLANRVTLTLGAARGGRASLARLAKCARGRAAGVTSRRGAGRE